MHFIALDFETANADLASICQIGMVAFADGRVHWVWSTLVNPEDRFDEVNVSIHGIDAATVERAPTFPRVADGLRTTLEGQIVVCHSPFDRTALHQVNAKYGLTVPSCRWLDTMRVVRRAWPEQFARAGYGLKNVASWCEIEFEHHRADEDARAAGEVLLKAMAETGLSVEEWLVRVHKPILDTRKALSPAEGNPDGPLAGERITFTGALSMPRSEAVALATEAGCSFAPGVTKKTTLLVVGQQDLRRLEGRQKSSKQRKAEALIAKGQSIRVLGEDDFRRLVDLHPSV